MLKGLITRKSSPTVVTTITHYNDLTTRLSLWSANPYSAQSTQVLLAKKKSSTQVWNNRIYYVANPSNNWNKFQIWNLDTLLIFLSKIKRPSMVKPSLAAIVAGCGIRISGAPLDITTCLDHNDLLYRNHIIPNPYPSSLSQSHCLNTTLTKLTYFEQFINLIASAFNHITGSSKLHVYCESRLFVFAPWLLKTAG